MMQAVHPDHTQTLSPVEPHGLNLAKQTIRPDHIQTLSPKEPYWVPFHHTKEYIKTTPTQTLCLIASTYIYLHQFHVHVHVLAVSGISSKAHTGQHLLEGRRKRPGDVVARRPPVGWLCTLSGLPSTTSMTISASVLAS